MMEPDDEVQYEVGVTRHISNYWWQRKETNLTGRKYIKLAVFTRLEENI